MSNIQQKLLCFLDWIMIKEDVDKIGYGINTALVLSFGIISIITSILTLFSPLFFTSNGLSIIGLLLRTILGGIFLAIGLGSVYFIRKSLSHKGEDAFLKALNDLPACLPPEENVDSINISEIKQLIGIGPETEKEPT